MEKSFLFERQVFYGTGASKMCSEKETSLLYGVDQKQAENTLRQHIKNKEKHSCIRSINIKSKTIL